MNSQWVVNKVDIVRDEFNERKKEVNDGLCGKSAPCGRGPRPRLSRTRHRLVIDWIQLHGETWVDTVDESRWTDRDLYCKVFRKFAFWERHVNDNAESPDKWNGAIVPLIWRVDRKPVLLLLLHDYCQPQRVVFD